MLRLGLLTLTCVLSGIGSASAWALQDQRASVAAERRAAAERLSQQERECQSRFVVTACVDEARAQHRQTLAALRDREWQLDQAERQERANQKRQELQRKQEAVAARPPAQQAQAQAVLAEDKSAAAVLPERPNKVQALLREAPSVAQVQAAASHVKAAERRAAKAVDAQARVKARVKDHDAKQAARYAGGKKRPDPLPVPGAASAAAR
jgi:colicin import membrane protein